MKDNSSKREDDSAIKTSETSSNKATGVKQVFSTLPQTKLGMEFLNSTKSTVSCPNCGAENPKKSKFCKECGAEFTSRVICPECGAEVKDSKFCSKCGANLVSDEETFLDLIDKETYSESNEKESKPPILIIAGIIGIVLIALFLLFGANQSSQLTANGFTVDLPGCSVENYTAGFWGKVVPMYIISNENGENVLNISYLPSKMGGDTAVKNLESYLNEEGYTNIESCEISGVSGYKGVSENYDSEGKKTAFLSLENSDYCYVIDYNNEGNLSLLNDNINFTKDKIPVTVTKPDSDISLSEGTDLKAKDFTLKTPSGWFINKKSIEDGTSYAIKSDKNSTRIKIVVTDLSSYNPQKNEIKGAINDLMDSVNSTDKHRYNIGDTKGYSFYSENTEKYVIVTNYKNKIYMSSYTDEESLKVLNTIQFK